MCIYNDCKIVIDLNKLVKARPCGVDLADEHVDNIANDLRRRMTFDSLFGQVDHAIWDYAEECNIDLSDVYMQYTTVESWTCEDGIVKNGSQQIDSGFGIRSISVEKTGFSYGNNFHFDDFVWILRCSTTKSSRFKLNMWTNNHFRKV